MELENSTVSHMPEKGEEKIAYVNPDLAELIPWFLDNRRKDIEAINNMVSSGDYKSLERIGHTLKGTCPGYGFDELGKIGARIETAAKSSSGEEILKLNGEMKEYLEEVKVVYR
jgi:HPt (histidine-containing phosphotransfer) domain-containing protein